MCVCGGGGGMKGEDKFGSKFGQFPSNFSPFSLGGEFNTWILK